MGFGIYKGYIVKINSTTNKLAVIVDEFDSYCVPLDDVIPIDDAYFKAFEQEFLKIKGEVQEIRDRIGRLDKEYFKKSEALKILLMDARKKEFAITNKILNQISQNKE